MRLENNFYTINNIEQKSDDAFAVEVTILPEHQIYEGHFPQQPVVPGVCTLTIIREIIGNILSKEVHFASIKECKYVSALIPQEDLRIMINLTITESKVTAVVERVDDQQMVLKLKASLK